jgi:hypothetical protein
MYDMVSFTPKAIVIVYILFMGACVLTYPIVDLLINAVRGANKWK